MATSAFGVEDNRISKAGAHSYETQGRSKIPRLSYRGKSALAGAIVGGAGAAGVATGNKIRQAHEKRRKAADKD